MRIRRPAPGMLIVQDAAIRSRVIGAICTALGLTTVALADSIGGSAAWLVVIFGSIITLVGLLVLRGIAAQTVTFDRAAGLVQVQTQHLLGVSADRHRLSDVTNVVVERDNIGGERDFYRTAFVMRDGTHRGWSYAFSDSFANLAAAVRTIRDFLGTAASPTAPDGTVAIPQPAGSATAGAALATAAALTAYQRRLVLAGSVFVYIVGSTLVAGGIWLAWSQHLRLATYLPVSATVESVNVVAVRDQNGVTTGRPAVRYRYQVGGVVYNNDRVTPFAESRTGNWASAVAGRYHPGETLTAYYDPTHPDDAFLERTTTPMPWLLMVGPLLFMAVWTAALGSNTRRRI